MQMTDHVYLSVQLWLIAVLAFADGVLALIHHPEWFQ